MGIFALASVCALWKFLHERSIERRLETKGFEPCDPEAPSLEGSWRALARSDASQELRLVNCRRRATRRGMLYHFTVRKRPPGERGIDDTANPGASYPTYLFDPRDPNSLSRGPIIGLGESRPSLEVGAH